MMFSRSAQGIEQHAAVKPRTADSPTKVHTMGLHDDNNPIRDDGPMGADAVRAGLEGNAARAAMIRAAADGELTQAEAESVAGADAGTDAAIAFERTLRDATGRAMSGIAAPEGLREKIMALAASSRSEDDALADALDERASVTRSPGFWSGLSIRGRIVGTLAAALLLAFVGVFSWQLGAASNGGTNGLNTPGGVKQAMIAGPEAGSPADSNLTYRTSLARFVAGEHTRTLDDAYAARKVVYTAPDTAADEIGSRLAHTPVIPPCGGETRFAGASPCGVPGNGPSAHMQFVLPVHDASGDIVAGAEGRKVSVFVKQDKGELNIEDGTTYLVDSDACSVGDSYICVWRRDGLLYTLVSEDRNAPMCTKFLAQFGVEPPDPAHSL